jgi:hypothetical protein
MEETNLGEMEREGEDCFCKTAFFHAKFPSDTSLILETAPNSRVFPLHDNVFTKSNSSIYVVDPSNGCLYIKKPGTYMCHMDIDVAGIDGDWVQSAMWAYALAETPEGYTPVQSQLVPLLVETINEEIIDYRRARFHSTVVLHVGDATYGIDSPSAKVSFRTETEGDFSFVTQRLNLTITKIG